MSSEADRFKLMPKVRPARLPQPSSWTRSRSTPETSLERFGRKVRAPSQRRGLVECLARAPECERCVCDVIAQAFVDGVFGGDVLYERTDCLDQSVFSFH